MSLSERLGIAAQLRATKTSPLKVMELTRRDIGVDVTGPTAAVDLRAEGPVQATAPGSTSPMPAPAHGGAPISRLTLRRQRLERRNAKLSEHPAAPLPAVGAPLCPRCGTQSRIDINDRTRGVLHVSCDECFTMWQVPAFPASDARPSS